MNDTTAGRIALANGGGGTLAARWRTGALPTRVRRADVRHSAPVSPTAPTVPADKLPTQFGPAAGPPPQSSRPGPSGKSPAPIIGAVVAVLALGGAGYFVWSSRQATSASGVMNGPGAAATPAAEARRTLDPRGIGNLNDLAGAGGQSGPVGALNSLVPPPPPAPVETPRPRREETAERPQVRPPATPHTQPKAEKPAVEAERPRHEESHPKNVLDPSRAVKSAIERQQKTHDVSDDTNPLGIPGG